MHAGIAIVRIATSDEWFEHSLKPFLFHDRVRGDQQYLRLPQRAHHRVEVCLTDAQEGWDDTRLTSDALLMQRNRWCYSGYRNGSYFGTLAGFRSNRRLQAEYYIPSTSSATSSDDMSTLWE